MPGASGMVNWIGHDGRRRRRVGISSLRLRIGFDHFDIGWNEGRRVNDNRKIGGDNRSGVSIQFNMSMREWAFRCVLVWPVDWVCHRIDIVAD